MSRRTTDPRAGSVARSAGRRGGFQDVLLRRLPGETPMHRLGLGTKLLGLTALTVATGLNTGWAQLIGVGAIAVLTVIAARVPLRAVPRLPRWFGATLVLGFALAAAGGGAERFLRLVGFGLLFVVLSLVVAWTTDLGELAPTLARFGAPLRRAGLPVDEWAVTAALAVRCLPLILEEIRTVVAAHRQRAGHNEPDQLARAVVDMITASMAAAVRRGSDLGEVIAIRGGMTIPPRRSRRPHARDLAALLVVAAASVAPALVA